MGLGIDSLTQRATALGHALWDWVSDENTTPAHAPAAQLQPSPAEHRLLSLSEDDRNFLRNLARSEPLPEVLARLIDLLERDHPALRGVITLVRNGRVAYAVAPSLGGRFAAIIEDIVTRRLQSSDRSETDDRTSTPAGLAVTRLSQNADWQKHKAALLNLDLKVAWDVPIRLSGQTHGTFTVFTSLMRPPTPAEAQVLADIADRAALAVDHQQFIDEQAHQSLYDPLTLLPNRLLLEDRFQNALDRARRGNWRVAFNIVRIDRTSGDELVRQVGNRLRQSVRLSDTVARIGADEFAVVAPELRDHEGAEGVAAKLVEALNAPFLIAGRDVTAVVNLGAAVFPEDGGATDALYLAADRALQRASHLGPKHVTFYDTDLGNVPAENPEAQMQTHLRRAIELNELYLEYQPQFDGDGRIAAVEALMRWNSAAFGPVAPARFIPIAEQTGLMAPMGEWALREAARQIQIWSRTVTPAPRVAVNISPLQFAQPHFCRNVRELVRDFQIAPYMLELELTESLLMQNQQVAAEKLVTLRELGIRVAIDDFGAGYSSLAQLRRLNIDTIKIDRDFIRQLCEPNGHEDSTAVVRAMIAMATHLGFGTVAEGVETAAQQSFLIREGCQLMQGFFRSRSLPAEQITKMMEDAAHSTVARIGGIESKRLVA